jgi:hypothetical protein
MSRQAIIPAGPRPRRSDMGESPSLPWFADDDALGRELLGADRAGEFKAIATLEEARGFPKVDPMWGGRYVPAVRAYLDHAYGIAAPAGPPAPLQPNGVENLELWNRRSRRRE